MSAPDRGAARNETTRRCIWVTEDECPDWAYQQWLAAPANPVEAFAIARNGRGRPAEQWRERWEMLPQEHRDFYLKRASEDLAALGWEATA